MKKMMMILTIGIALAGMGCASSPDARGKSAVLIVPTEIQDAEINEVTAALQGIGCSVTVAAASLDDITGLDGGTFTPDILFSQVREEDYDIIVGIGGMGIFQILDNEDVQGLFTAFYNAGKYTTAICGSSALLANAGLLEGKQATTFPYDPLIQLLKDGGAEYVDTEVVVSGMIITGNGPGASVAFGEALAEALK